MRVIALIDDPDPARILEHLGPGDARRRVTATPLVGLERRDRRGRERKARLIFLSLYR